MKVYIRQRTYNFCGLKGTTYNVCDAPGKDSRRFCFFEKRKGFSYDKKSSWLLWDTQSSLPVFRVPANKENERKLVEQIKEIIVRQVYMKTGEKLSPSDIELAAGRSSKLPFKM